MTATIAPDERAFREHLAGGAFRMGEASGFWRCLRVAWPVAEIAITAAERPRSPSAFHFRFDLSGYPSTAPTARLWEPGEDGKDGSPLPVARWPVGGPRISSVFRANWQGGSCLYLPCDRLSMSGHSDWPSRYRAQWWTAGCDITHFLKIVHELLTSVDYTGVRS